ncbi:MULTISPECIES: NAD(+) diphosphatase [Rhodomicrobium]|uniref:NAD(+) diphosphatase n=1 Tax=Rhodomicrobium TaxID=1068 RepID=UPI000B4B98D2|nr:MULTISPECIES: NAD(+) diphosphatase [Rhodomicrobium]
MTDRPQLIIPHITAQTAFDRAAEKRRDTEWLDTQRASPEARLFLLIDLKFAIRSDPDRSKTRLRPFTARELGSVGLEMAGASFLGIAEDGAPLFALCLSPSEAARLPDGAETFAPLVDLRTLANQGEMPPAELTLAAQMRGLAAWHATNRCCSRCGGKLELREGGWRLDCWACGQLHFPRSDPAVIMLITQNGQCLMGHEPRFQDNMYSVLAGFVEPGDDIETAVRREIMEEAGIRVGRVEYVASQPWPFPHQLMIGCWGEALNSDLTLDPVEMPEARWFGREEVRQMLDKVHPRGHFVPPPLSISHMLIRAFADGVLG